jgi:hypothetical protein
MNIYIFNAFTEVGIDNVVVWWNWYIQMPVEIDIMIVVNISQHHCQRNYKYEYNTARYLLYLHGISK